MTAIKRFDTRKLILIAILTTMVIIMQILAIIMKPLFPAFTISLVLMPIAIGAALLGTLAGAWLGLVFGFIVLISGDATPFLAINPAATIFVVLLKGTLAGLSAGLLYNSLEHINKTVAAFAAAIICPVVNTGIFIAGCYIFFLPTLTDWGIAAEAVNVTSFIFFGLIGVNFFIELGTNLVLSPVIVRLIQYRIEMKIESTTG